MIKGIIWFRHKPCTALNIRYLLDFTDVEPSSFSTHEWPVGHYNMYAFIKQVRTLKWSVAICW